MELMTMEIMKGVIGTCDCTVPTMKNSGRCHNPHAAPTIRDAARHVNLSVRGGPGGTCEVYWNLTKVTNEELLERAVNKLEAEIAKVGGAENITEETMPEAHIRGDINTPYKCVGGTVFTMQRAGFARVGFISMPPPGATVKRL